MPVSSRVARLGRLRPQCAQPLCQSVFLDGRLFWSFQLGDLTRRHALFCEVVLDLYACFVGDLGDETRGHVSVDKLWLGFAGNGWLVRDLYSPSA